jgi:hypothetical protein
MSEQTSDSIDRTGLEPGDDVEPNAYAEHAARLLFESETESFNPDLRDATKVVRALDRLTYAVLGVVTAINQHPGALTVVESGPIEPQVDHQRPPAGALTGPFFVADGQRYSHSPDGAVPVDENGFPVSQ